MNQVDKERIAQLRSYGTFTREQVEEYVVLVDKERHPEVELPRGIEHVELKVEEVKKSKKR